MRVKPIFFFSLIGLLAAFAIYSSGGGNLAIGSVAPDFELKDPDGKLVHLSDFRGKFVFLNFWATWCEPCVDEMPAMMTLNETLKDRDFQMLAVSVDTRWEAIEEFYAQYELDLPTLLDPAQAVSRGRYKATGFPETFLIDQNGHVRDIVIGPRLWADPQVIAQIEEMMDQPIAEDATR